MILASASPRRKEILSLLTEDFKIIPAVGEEVVPLGVTPKEVVESLALQKAMEVFKANNTEIVIGSDTVVEESGVILGKPKNVEDAAAQLRSLSGKVHFVHTGVAVVYPDREPYVFSVSSAVRFAPLSEDEISEYIGTGETMDKAGSYAIQGLGGRFIEKNEDGDYYAIMGLPLQPLYKSLKEYLK